MGGWRRAMGKGDAEPCVGHGLGMRGAGPRGRRARGRAGQPGPCLVPPRPEPRCCRGAVGSGRARWQLPGPRQRERGGCLCALRPVSGAGALGGRGDGLGFLECMGRAWDNGTPAPPRVESWLYAEAKEGCREHFLSAVCWGALSGALREESMCSPVATVAVRRKMQGLWQTPSGILQVEEAGWECKDVHLYSCVECCIYRDWVSEW